MKFLRSTILLALAVATAHVNGHVAYDTGLVLGEDVAMGSTPSLRRSLEEYRPRRLADGSNTGSPPPSTTTAAPTTTPPPTTTAPPTTTPPPTTTAPPTTTPPPTTTAPPTTTPPPTTTAPPTTTEHPTTTTPKPSENDNKTTTPPPTTSGPSTTPPTQAPESSTGSDLGTKTTSPPKTNKLTDNSQTGETKTDDKKSKMSTGTIIGIVGGIVVGVGILAVIAVVMARKRREEDDDPLSPFELSMDKGYNGAGASGYTGAPQNQAVNQNQYGNQNQQYGNENQYRNNNNNSLLAYGGRGRGGSNAMAVGGAAAVGAAAGVGAAALLSTDTPSANSDAAGVAYTQFYDPVTSPTSYHQDPNLNNTNISSDLSTNRTDPNITGTNLWMSAMEPKENDVEGAGESVPPSIALSDDLDIDTNNSFMSRNSYDELPGTSIDIDQSSVLSGNSDLDTDIPDYEDESARGSYEL